ncbi:SAM-dependent methyltransferase [Nocardia arizonensis]|uniref:SAM-dependent methyltransferase n=1 Tax=Nocardia arizonensis TaxID=1141647 RepID=UPI001EF447DB|nr:cyclopropane-fatty-acyl-phospholipid synthase family protein [Nocardia arizonensis]
MPLRVQMWDGTTAGPAGAPLVVVSSRDALRRLLWHPGELGLARAYVAGEIDGDPRAVLEQLWSFAASIPPDTFRLTPGRVIRLLTLAWKLRAIGMPLPPPATQIRVKGRSHSLARDRAVIAHHYDLPAEFYALVLDPAMTYSCAYFTDDRREDRERQGYDLEVAQLRKLDLVCAKVGLAPGMRLLDIGCGWGALSMHAAQRYGAHVVAVTISREQKAYIEAESSRRGLADRIDVRLQDYRQIADRDFDAVVSLEMGEHVGDEQYPYFAAQIRDRAASGARVLVQQMSRDGRYPGGGPFIESFIAPDMSMRPLGDTINFFERAGLEVIGVEGMREHYARTVDGWLCNFESHRKEITALVGEEQARIWHIYLVGGGMAFRQGRMGVHQILMVRSTSRR